MPVLTPFRRLTDPLQVPVGASAQRTDVPGDYIPDQAESFWICNPNNFWVRLKGSGTNRLNGNTMSGDYKEVVGDLGFGTGWHFPPGYCGVFMSQKPRYLSTIATGAQGLTPSDGFLELAWGSGV